MRAPLCRAATFALVSVSIAATGACQRACGSHPSGSDAGSAQDPSTAVGIPECDDYLARYERCIATSVPSDRKKGMQDSLERTRSQWKALAANPGARPGLPQACQLALETARTTMKQYPSCMW